MRITEAARSVGVSARALRYYEDEGLVHPERTAGGHREYSEALVDRIRLVLCLRSAGLSMASTRMALSSVDASTIDPEAVARLRAERRRLTRSIDSLSTARDELDDLISTAMDCTDGAPAEPGES